MRYKKIFWLLLATASFAACNNEDATTDAVFDTDALYFDYQVRGDEESGLMTCLLQYHNGGPDGETVLLPAPATVQLDNDSLFADSAQQTGAFYELRKPVADFAGNHTVTFTDQNGKKFIENFVFTPFTLTNEFGEAIQRGDLVIATEGLTNGDAVRVVLIDTSFATNDLNGSDTVQDGKIMLTKDQLKNVANGPVTLQLYKEEERGLKNAPAEGGRLLISYSITRGFDLRD